MRVGLPLLPMLLVFGFAQANAMADEPTVPVEPRPVSPVRIRFLPPPMQGVFTLAVYDPGGRRVRLLSEAAGIEQFELARDGLEILWDGCDDAGKPLPHGSYTVQGAVIGGITARRVAVHAVSAGNTTADPQITAVDGIAFQGRPGGETLKLTAMTTSGNRVLIDFSRNGTLATGGLDVGSKGISALGDAGVADRRSGFSRALHWHISGNRLVGQEREQLFGPPQVLIDLGDLPDPSIISWEEAPLILSGGQLWKIESNALKKFPTELRDPVIAASGAGPERLWVVAATGRGNVLMQLLANGTVDRVLEAGPEDASPLLVAGMAARDEVATLGVKNGVPSLRWIRHAEAVEGESSWEIVLEHSFAAQGWFTLAAGKPVPASEEPRQTVVRVQLREDELGNTAKRVANLHPALYDSGVLLEDEKQLPFVRVPMAGARQAVVEGVGRNGAARLFIRTGGSVEEFEIGGLENVIRFNCGAYSLGGE
jgi:hypothetical protein